MTDQQSAAVQRLRWLIKGASNPVTALSILDDLLADVAELERRAQLARNAIDALTSLHEQLDAIRRVAEAERDEWRARALAAEALLNTPELVDFASAVVREAAHQRNRWGEKHDAEKSDADWFWLVGYVAGKALHKPEKRLHHIITTASVLANWHAAELARQLKDVTP